MMDNLQKYNNGTIRWIMVRAKCHNFNEKCGDADAKN